MLFEPLFTHAEKQPHEIAIVDDTGQYTYQQLAAMCAGLGMYLGMATSQPRVGLLLPAGVGFVASFYGTLLAGKSVVPINFLLGDREVAHVIKDSGIDTVVTIPQLAGRLKDTPLKVIDLTQLPKAPPAAITPRFPSPDANDLAVLMYTSGTSGPPKGVMLSYGNIQSDVDSAIEKARLEHRHKFLGIIPLFHSFGMTAMMVAPIQLGSTVVYMARFNPVATVNAIREHQVSLLFGVPSMFGAILHLKNASQDDFRSIYAIITGGEPLNAALREAFLTRFGTPLLEGYGLTETSPVVALNTPQDMKPGTVGRPLPGVLVKITDDDGRVLGTDEVGEVWLKGPMIMKGYFNLPDATSQALTADAYFKTGDLGKIDPEGYLHITGRKKELIIVAGEKVHPREIEEVIGQHPAVQAVAVVGKKDPGRGEIVVAFVVPKENQTITSDAIRKFCNEQGLVGWKVPREVRVVEDLPRSPTGKVLKRVLQDSLTSAADDDA